MLQGGRVFTLSRGLFTNQPTTYSVTMAQNPPSNGPYQYPSGYKSEIGRPLGIPADKVNRWLSDTGIPIREEYPGRAPDKDTPILPPAWVQCIRRLYLDRQPGASQVNDSATDWARVPWPSTQHLEIPVKIQQPLSEVFVRIKHRYDKMRRSVHQPAVQPGSAPAAQLPSSASTPVPDSATVDSKPDPTPSTLDHPAPPAFSYMGSGVVPRTLSLEVAEIPPEWVGPSPEELGLDVLNYPIWGSPTDVPSLPLLVSFIHDKYERITATGKYYYCAI